jgi:hypothetical protein
MSDQDHAVVVGITNYPSLTPLKGPENDARAFRDWLLDKGGGAVPKDNIACILSSQFAKTNDPADRNRTQPTVDSVIAAFADLMDKADDNEDGRVGRRLYIFLAGHGVAPNVDDAALLAANAARSRLYHLPGGKLAASFRTAPMFDEVVLLMDCCRDHSARLPEYVLPWTDRSEPGRDPRWWYGFATKWAGKARERKMDGGKVRGLFTHVLLDGLREGHTTTGQLQSFIKARLPQVAGPDDYHEPVFTGHDDLILTEAAGPPSVRLRVSFGRTRRGVMVDLLNGALVTVGSHPHGGEPWEIDVPPGIYSVKASDKDRPKLVTITRGTADVKI